MTRLCLIPLIIYHSRRLITCYLNKNKLLNGNRIIIDGISGNGTVSMATLPFFETAFGFSGVGQVPMPKPVIGIMKNKIKIMVMMVIK